MQARQGLGRGQSGTARHERAETARRSHWKRSQTFVLSPHLSSFCSTLTNKGTIWVKSSCDACAKLIAVRKPLLRKGSMAS